MFSSTFRIFIIVVSQELCESCFAFLFKVYIKKNQIRDILPTSKMDLIMTIGICKVIFCRLMVLHTQYCPMSVFHHQTSGALCDNNYPHCCILLGNCVARTVSSYEFLDFCVSSLLNPSQFRWFQLVPDGSR